MLIAEWDRFIEEKEGKIYLNISLTHSNNEVLIKYAEVWSGIKDQIKKINDGSVGENAKDYMKIKFNSDDDLPLNKILESVYWQLLSEIFLKKTTSTILKFF